MKTKAIIPYLNLFAIIANKTCSETNVLIQDVEGGFVNVPLHKIYFSSDLVNGPVALDIRHSSPFNDVHMLLGNDLAEERVVVNPLVTDMTYHVWINHRILLIFTHHVRLLEPWQRNLSLLKLSQMLT